MATSSLQVRPSECSICMIPYTTSGTSAPHALSCHHTFCLNCIEALQKSITKSCALCHVEIRPEHVSKNFVLIEEIEKTAQVYAQFQQAEQEKEELKRQLQALRSGDNHTHSSELLVIEYMIEKRTSVYEPEPSAPAEPSDPLPVGLRPIELQAPCSSTDPDPSAPPYQSDLYDLPPKEALPSNTIDSEYIAEPASLLRIREFVNTAWEPTSLSVGYISQEGLRDAAIYDVELCCRALDKIGERIQAFHTDQFPVPNKLQTLVKRLESLYILAAVPEAAKNGHNVARYAIGYIIKHKIASVSFLIQMGIVTKSNPPANLDNYGFSLLCKAADAGYPPAQAMIGWYHYVGVTNRDIGLKYLNSAAFKRNVLALYYLGTTDRSGSYYKQAADLGHADAQYQYGLLIRALSITGAIHMMRLAANQGHKGAAEKLEELNYLIEGTEEVIPVEFAENRPLASKKKKGVLQRIFGKKD